MTSDSPKPRRRTISAAEKARILAAYDQAASPLERAEIMRREAVYSSLLSNWRKQLGGANSSTPKRGRPAESHRREIERLQRENERLKRRAERAEDMVDTLGKVHALLQTAADKSATEKQPSTKRSRS